MPMLKPMSKKDSKILDKIFGAMEPGTSKRINNSKTYMYLSVERLTSNSYSMAHYYEQNGDLVADPDIELLRAKNGEWYPIALQQSTGAYTRAIEYYDKDGYPTKAYPMRYSELRSFLSMWLKNLKDQQGL
jgi:hypothetical protein